MAVGSDAAEQSRARTSRHLSHAIQAGFHKDAGALDTGKTEEKEMSGEDVLSLPAMTVTGGPRIDSRAFNVEEPPKPVLGTGVTEFKGRKFTFKLRRIFFVPVAFNLAW